MIRATSAKALPMLLGDPGGSVSLKTFDRMLDRMLDRFLDRLPSICRAVCSSPCDVVQERLSSASAKRFSRYSCIMFSRTLATRSLSFAMTSASDLLRCAGASAGGDRPWSLSWSRSRDAGFGRGEAFCGDGTLVERFDIEPFPDFSAK